MSVIPGVSFGDQLLCIVPRFGYQFSDNFAASIGALQLLVADESGGIAFASASIGPPSGSMTAGIGIPYGGDDIADVAIIILGGSARMTRQTSLISENWIFSAQGEGGGETFSMFSAGIRFFVRQMSADFVLVLPEESDVVIPWLSFTYRLGD